MMGKKVVAVLFGLLMLAMPFTISSVSAETSVTVILVSDNAADKAIAEYLANETGAVVVTTTWGTYDPNVTAEIMSYAPDEVIIIGGPEAVVEEYVSDLQELGITVERWGGQNRYETNIMVMEQAQVRFQLQFNGSVVVAGNDTLAIRNALRIAVQNGAMITYVNASTNVTRLMERLQVRNVTLISTNASETVMEQVKNQLRACNCTSKEVRANVTREDVLMLMEQVRERLMEIEAIANVTNSTGLMEQVRLMERLMETANQSIQEGRYEEAYGTLVKLQAQTEFALKMANGEMRVAMKTNQRLALEVEMEKLEAQIRVMEKAGIDVSAINALMEQLKEAIKNGQYDEAKEMMNQIKTMLREAYTSGRDAIRANVPGSRGPGKFGP
ncbi:hypothetical protein CL1_1524 [Thermococcus cleftensis]|uniref:Uncharacterized protein n=1 Tax=Thermococcus cleftensis (strain DSM 27260 / KACC 17922 / CL1) TaxID=163003 RepID=I3ZVI9_THECF|nr:MULTISPECIES: hypothetical protein [Thermococcus]AFL95723.1 hypothetical protein CL1_1524 [Thermococcus cleftensis]NJE04492.1 cell wall-binding repeat 2 family protein [Thermococcus sp. MV11]